MASCETDALIRWVMASGVPFRVTSVDTGTHAPKSRHYQWGTPGPNLPGRGLAVDFAGPTPGDADAMLAIYRVLLPEASHLHELIYGGPGITDLVRRKVRVVPAAYGAATLAAHRNHVHVSVDKGTFLRSDPNKEIRAMFDPALQVAAWCLVGYDGGGLVAVAPDGAVYCEPPTLYRGGPNGQAYWGDRRAARVEPNDRGGYDVTATNGDGPYSYPET